MADHSFPRGLLAVMTSLCRREEKDEEKKKQSSVFDAYQPRTISCPVIFYFIFFFIGTES